MKNLILPSAVNIKSSDCGLIRGSNSLALSPAPTIVAPSAPIDIPNPLLSPP